MSDTNQTRTGQDDREEDYRGSSVERPPLTTAAIAATFAATAGYSEAGQPGAGTQLPPTPGSTEGEDASLDASDGDDDTDDGDDDQKERDRDEFVDYTAEQEDIKIKAAAANAAMEKLLEAQKGATAAMQDLEVSIDNLQAKTADDPSDDRASREYDRGLEGAGGTLNAIGACFSEIKNHYVDLEDVVGGVNCSIEQSSNTAYTDLGSEFGDPNDDGDGAQASAPADPDGPIGEATNPGDGEKPHDFGDFGSST